jgi:hypothetical protein
VPTTTSNLRPLAWLADAPLFLDTEQVTAFYDATIKPEFDTGVITISQAKLKGSKTSAEGGVSGEISIAAWLKTIFPFLDAKASINGKVARETSKSEEETDTIELHPIRTPQRQLVQLALHYATNLQRRLVYSTGQAEEPWLVPSFAKELPRALIFLDLPPSTTVIPTAAELNEGRVVTFYDKLVPALSHRSKTLPNDYPPDTGMPEHELESLRSQYWSWYSDNFDSRDAVRIVESVISESPGRIRWIDFRTPTAAGTKTVHLHLAGREHYDTGVFAYNFVRRCSRHGIRIVGTLKSGLDLNVLAVFDS